MWSQYDENLSINPFFKEIYEHHFDIVKEASLRQWIICIPRIGTIDHSTITSNVILDHIIIPDVKDEPCHTLSKKQIYVCNKQILMYSSDEESSIVDIMFEETYYINNDSKFILWCVDRPLFFQTHNYDLNYNKNLLSIHDCIDFLWCESLNHDILDCLKCLACNFNANNTFEFENIQTQKELIGVLFSQCLQQSFKYPAIKKKFKEDSKFLERLKQAVEAYMQYCLGRKLIFSINTTTAQKDSSLNLIIKKYSDIQYCDLGIESYSSTIILNAKCELNQINSYYTVLDKISCLKKTIGVILGSGEYLKDKCITSDDILLILVYLILKLNVNNWFGNLTYMKEFQLSVESSDETLFCISSLEAALQFIFTNQCNIKINVNKVMQPEEIAVNNIENKIKFDNVLNISDLYSQISAKSQMCHPLCTCSKCDNILQHSKNTISYLGGVSISDMSMNLLIQATILDKCEVVDFLLKNEVNVNYSNSIGKTSLHYAALKGFQDVLLLLINKKALVNVQDNEKNTPLHLACLNGHENCVKALLYSSSEVELNIGNFFGDTPIMVAARWGYLDIVQILLENGASVIIKNKKNQTIFDVAHNAHIIKVCKMFTNKNVNSHLMLEISTETFISRFDHCYQHHGIRPRNADQLKKIDILLKSIENNDFPLTCFYLGYNNTTQTVKSGKCHPLCLCDTCNKEQFDYHDTNKSVQTVNVNMCDDKGYTPLHIAAKFGRSDTLRMLLDNGALPNLKTYEKFYTPLHLACIYERIQVIRELVKCGDCNVDGQDSEGNTPLIYACQKGNIKITEILLNNGADCDKKNFADKSALMISGETLQYGIFKLLKHNSKSKFNKENQYKII